ncbi:hypothetical protein ASPWEDRAFT_44086 [Aspergillus wentii DTO 134E9]|uniref:Uncharacterized protein n=1 Tax=Aspergillus wentii DTO 134E9 TaxID=1073089 RepID=A0A1L9RAW4_ASPWE|nr:uncharacterized protein ASPWEDRAFT_44086 [Aspergillus wentii DTO 134E9]OJJ32061.1 hypothetical protein ASPWEDRAFT_44086 [Aspergillus wentii DTO 134E9]
MSDFHLSPEYEEDRGIDIHTIFKLYTIFFVRLANYWILVLHYGPMADLPVLPFLPSPSETCPIMIIIVIVTSSFLSSGPLVGLEMPSFCLLWNLRPNTNKARG